MTNTILDPKCSKFATFITSLKTFSHFAVIDLIIFKFVHPHFKILATRL